MTARLPPTYNRAVRTAIRRLCRIRASFDRGAYGRGAGGMPATARISSRPSRRGPDLFGGVRRYGCGGIPRCGQPAGPPSLRLHARSSAHSSRPSLPLSAAPPPLSGTCGCSYPPPPPPGSCGITHLDRVRAPAAGVSYAGGHAPATAVTRRRMPHAARAGPGQPYAAARLTRGSGFGSVLRFFGRAVPHPRQVPYPPRPPAKGFTGLPGLCGDPGLIRPGPDSKVPGGVAAHTDRHKTSGRPGQNTGTGKEIVSCPHQP